MERRGNPLVRFLLGLGRVLEWTARLAVLAVFLLAALLLVIWMLPSSAPRVEQGSALVLAPNGELVEQLEGYPAEQILLDLLGEERRPQTLVRELLEAVEAAAEDERIGALVLDLDRMGGAGLSKLQRLGEAIRAFRESGKPVVAHADFLHQSSYHLAAQADEVYLHPMGLVFIQGYGSYRNYYQEALDRLAVEWNVFRAGEYKSAVEPYTRSGMSPESREARGRYLEVLWQTYKEEVAGARGLEPEAIQEFADRFHLAIRAAGGDAARAALDAGLVDRLAHRDQVRSRLVDLVGESGEGTGDYRGIDHRAYLRAGAKPESKSRNLVAVVVAKGVIAEGMQPPGIVGGDSTAELIRRARQDDRVKALVLRVDSPGGSNFASEVIRREVVLAREAGKPVVASMGSVAASGGYWISMSADEIWASPTTITGSIGVYAMLPTFRGTLEKLGVRTDGVGTTRFAGTLRLDRDLPEEVREVIQLMVDEDYRRFVELTAEGRALPRDEVERAARGRPWAGVDAHRLGLVDELGDLEEAVSAAARLADLGDDYAMRYFEEEPTLRERLLRYLLSARELASGQARHGLLADLLEQGPIEALRDDLETLARIRDPRGSVSYCFCEPN